MRDRFSSLAAVCCEETIAKGKELRICLSLVLIIVSAEKSRSSIFVLGGSGTRNIKNTEKRFGVTDWMRRRWVCSLRMDSCMAEG